MKLYRVKLTGLNGYNSIGAGISYVIAEDSGKAYQKVRKFLDYQDYGFAKDREMDKIELIAEDCEYPDIGTMLFL